MLLQYVLGETLQRLAEVNLHVVVEFVSARQNLQTNGTLMNSAIRVKFTVSFVTWNGVFRVFVLTEATDAREVRGIEWILRGSFSPVLRPLLLSSDYLWRFVGRFFFLIIVLIMNINIKS